MGPTSPPAPPSPPEYTDDCIPLEKRTWRNVKKHAPNPDRISALPDDILIKILSLVTVKEAAMTDVLSPRWRHLWENVDHLTLHMDTFGMQVPANSDYRGNPDLRNSEATNFVNKVNGVLRHHKCNRIKKFEVKFPLSSVHSSEIDRWVAFAAASSSEMLNLVLSDYLCGVRVPTKRAERYNFPLKHYVDLRCCQLRYMFLSTCSLEAVLANLIGFSYLFSLQLDYVQVVDEVLQSIISSCRALHHLYLRRCDKLINLRTSHAELVTLEVSNCWKLFSISIHAEKLKCFSYMGTEFVNIEYECAPVLCELNALFRLHCEFPLDCIGAFPELKTLRLQFTSRLRLSHILHLSRRFTGLKEIMLCLLTSWKKSIRLVAYLLKAAHLVERLELEAHGNLRPLKKLKIRWPKNFTPTRLRTIRIGGFSGESEMVQLVFFLLWSPMLKTLLIDTHRRNCLSIGTRMREESEDAARCNYAREVVSTQLAPTVPSTVKFTIM
ncbi:unnamed protein product [Urochloa decumbens]|uniref:F-box domain-containing protein n=1 Tax=Urochloa decumbens TaxID=240449 RepID=A0ABC9EZP6_9POAL